MDTEPTQADGCNQIDPRIVFLERAAARLLLVELGAMDLDEAIGGLTAAFRDITDIPPCACDRERLERMERYGREFPARMKHRPKGKRR